MKYVMSLGIPVTLLMLALMYLGTPTQAATPITVTNTSDSGPGSLRQAMLDANANPGLDTVAFDIPAASDPGCNAGTGVCTIRPLSELPTITDPVTIDGYTQPGAGPNTNGPGLGLNTILKIELDGASAGADSDGLSIIAGASTVRGLVINRFSFDGIELVGDGGNVIEGNFIGTDVAGSADLGNGQGIFVTTPNNEIGGTAPSKRNLFAGNGGFGVIFAFVGTTGNVVQGNLIGVNASGTAGLANERSGVLIGFGAANNTVGGLTAAAGNVISGNGRHGVRIRDAGAAGNVFQGNLIGTDVSGTLDSVRTRFCGSLSRILCLLAPRSITVFTEKLHPFSIASSRDGKACCQSNDVSE